VIKVVRGRFDAIHPILWLIAGLFVVYFAISPITDWVS
jgi:AGZA family xanthine/uracil permease-like MFS transporter